MTTVIKYSEDTLGWTRKPGPLRVWRIVNGRTKNENGKNVQFSIQEIPENRMDDVMDLMCTIFIRDEPICNYYNAIDDPVMIEDFRKLWSFALRQGIVVGAFVVDENNPKPALAAVNMTLVACEAMENSMQTIIEFRAELMRKILGFMHVLETEMNIREYYKVDKWITAVGLCVDVEYRGQGLGVELLKARDEMSVAYDIRATSTIFTALAAQKNADRAGFELLIERNFVDIRNEDGIELFPGIPYKSVKLMGKKFNDRRNKIDQ